MNRKNPGIIPNAMEENENHFEKRYLMEFVTSGRAMKNPDYRFRYGVQIPVTARNIQAAYKKSGDMLGDSVFYASLNDVEEKDSAGKWFGTAMSLLENPGGGGYITAGAALLALAALWLVSKKG